jgi:hypothetical protein
MLFKVLTTGLTGVLFINTTSFTFFSVVFSFVLAHRTHSSYAFVIDPFISCIMRNPRPISKLTFNSPAHYFVLLLLRPRLARVIVQASV